MLAVAGCIIGTVVGALPGLGPSNGVAILIPLAFSLGLDATEALILMTSVYYGAMYGGRISSILLNIPGDEPALMTTLDGYPMAKPGPCRATRLVLSGVASFVGAFLATVGLVHSCPGAGSGIAFFFGPAEYFALYLLAFCTLGGMASNNQAKSALSVPAIGLGIAMIGLDNSSSGLPRLTGRQSPLSWMASTSLSSIVGLFAVAGGLLLYRKPRQAQCDRGQARKGNHTGQGYHRQRTGRFDPLRGSVIGFFAGVLPGAPAHRLVASWPTCPRTCGRA